MRSLSRAVFKTDEDSCEKLSFQDLENALESAVSETDFEVPEEEIYQEEKIIQQAVSKAQTILLKARNEAISIREKAYEDGYIKGMEKGCKDGEEKAYNEQKKALSDEYEAILQMTADYVADMHNAKEKVLEKYMDDLKNIALAIGEKIVQTSLKSSENVVKNMILAATERLKKSAWAKIYVAETDEEREMNIQGDADFLEALSHISDNVKVIVMGDVPSGTCIIELPQEVIDISVSTQLENIKEIINNARA